jgi:hypothetical protein
VSSVFTYEMGTFTRQTDGSPLSVSEEFGGILGNTMDLNVSAVSDFGELSAGAGVDVAINQFFGPSITASAVVIAGFVEEMLVDFAPFAGQTGYLQVNYNIDGTIVESGASAEAAVLVGLDPDGAGAANPEAQVAVYESSVSGGSASNVLPFVYGQPFHLRFWLMLALGSIEFTGADGLHGVPLTAHRPLQSAFAAASADFANTLTLTSFTLFDPAQHQTDSPTLTAGSGVTYDIAAVPEPSSLALVLVAAVAFGRARSLRNRTT